MRVLGLWVLLITAGVAHGFYTQTAVREATVVRIEDPHGDPIRFAFYDLHDPAGKLFQRGQSDLNGLVAFMPDKPGLWKLTAAEESDHGLHQVETLITVSEAGQPVAPRALRDRLLGPIAAVALIWGALSSWLYFKARRKLSS